MGRACDCCGSEDCLNISQPYGFSVDRYKPTYYSVSRELVEDYVVFYSIDEDGNSIREVFTDRSVVSEDFKIGSSREVFNYSYLSRLYSYDLVVADDALLEQYPKLREFLDQTHENTFRRANPQRTQLQNRVILEFDCSDIYDTSKDLYQYASLRLGDESDQNEKRPIELPFRQLVRNAETAFNIAGVADFSNTLRPKNFKQWDDLVGTLSFSRPVPEQYTGNRDLEKELNSIDVTDEELNIGSSVCFLLSPKYAGDLKSESLDLVKQGEFSYYKIDFHKDEDDIVYFEFIRPPFGDDLTEEQKDLRVFNVLRYGGGTNRPSIEDWHDHWERVDDMFTFVSKTSFLNRATDIIRSALTQDEFSGDTSGLNYRDSNYNNWDRDLQFSMKVFKASSGNKKSQVEQVYFDGLFYWDKTDTYKRIRRARNFGMDDDCSPVFTNPVSRSNNESRIGYTALAHDFHNDINTYWYGPFAIKHGVFEGDEESTRVAFINNVDNSEYLTHYNPFLGFERDIISITSNYFQSLSSNNWKKFGDFGYANSSITELVYRNYFYKNSNYEALRHYEDSNIPEVVDVDARTFFYDDIQSPTVKISFKNTRRKFAHQPINFYELGENCRNQCLFTDSPLEWEIREQEFSPYRMLHTILKINNFDQSRTGLQGFLELSCYSHFFSEDSLFEIHSEHEKLASKSVAVYDPTEEIIYSFGYFATSGPVCDQDAESFLTFRGKRRKHTVDRQKATGRVKGQFGEPDFYAGAGSWNDVCRGREDGGHHTHSILMHGPANFSHEFRTPSMFTAAAKHAKRSNKEPTKIIKDAGWNKKVKVERVTSYLTEGVGFIVDGNLFDPAREWKSVASGPDFTSGEKTDIVLGSLDLGFRDFLGAGIRYRYIKKPEYYQLSGRKGDPPSWREFLDEHWLPLYQEAEASYDHILSDEEISEIARLTMGKFEYWYMVRGNVFIEDPAGDTEKDNKPGYYIEDPYFKIDEAGKQHGPYKSESIPSPLKEVAVVVETNIKIPDPFIEYGDTGRRPNFYYSASDLDYDPLDPDPVFDFDPNSSTNPQEIIYVYGTSGHKSDKETEPFGIGSDPEKVYAPLEFLEDVEIPYFDCSNIDNTFGKLLVRPDTPDYCDFIYGPGWTEPPKLNTVSSTLIVPQAKVGCTTQIIDYEGGGSGPHTTCPEMPTFANFNQTNYSIEVHPDGYSYLKASERDGRVLRTCGGFVADIVGYATEPQGKEAERKYNLSDLYTDAIATTLGSVLKPELLVKTMRHKKIIPASELDSSLELSFDHEDGIYWRVLPVERGGILDDRDGQAYWSFDMDEATITADRDMNYFYSRDSPSHTEEQFKAGEPRPAPDKCPQSWPFAPPYFCIDGLYKDEFCSKFDYCESIGLFFTLGADNGAYGSPGEPFYDDTFEQASGKNANGLAKRSCTQVSTWMYETATDGDSFGDISNVADTRPRTPVDKDNSLYDQFEECVGQQNERTVDGFNLTADTRIKARVVMSLLDIYRDYTFTIGISE